MSSEKNGKVKPRLIIHGGAGNITRENLPPKAYDAYRNALLDVLQQAQSELSNPGASAIDVATFAVTLLENNGLFNAGHGAVYTTAGTHELEASVMVSRGYRKRGVGVMNVRRARNPILVAKEMLIRGEQEDGGGAQGHCQLQGAEVDRLTEQWGLETVRPSYFWTRRRWDEHRRGLDKKHDDETYNRHKREADHGYQHQSAGDTPVRDDSVLSTGEICIDEIGWDGKEYLPQGTVGAVVLDSFGSICCATSTGGLTNKLPGRIGDTPTLGAGFWAEEWTSTRIISTTVHPPQPQSSASLAALVSDCLPRLSGYLSLPGPTSNTQQTKNLQSIRAVGMSGTGNGDSFLRLSAVRTAAAMARFRSDEDESVRRSTDHFPLQYAVTQVAGPNGMLQQSAENRLLKTGEGEGGIIGIECTGGEGRIVYDYNCGGMFHAWIDDNGKAKYQVFRDQIDT